MIKAIVVDDEKAARENLQLMLQNIDPQIYVLEASNVLDARTLIDSNEPDIIFLDINMPEINGFELLELIDYKKYLVVIVSAQLDYSLTAIKKQVFDFLLKPYSFSTLRETINHLKEKLANKDEHKLNILNEKIVIKTKNEIHHVSVNEIIYVESDNNYSTYFLEKGSKILVSKTIKAVAEELNYPNFFRVHRSYIVNTNFILKYNSSENEIYLINGLSLPVSDRKRKEFLAYYTE